ncbi:MAG TPA: hypothetical protein VHY20_14980, partial [Pirellulales bacterium]|nr:hypothetical protein [Pirellulales bacterium]
MLRWRLLLGTLLVGLMILLCWLDSHAALRGAWLFPLALVMTLAATGEMLWMLGDWPSRPIPWVVYLGNAAIVCAAWMPLVLARHLVWWPGGSTVWILSALAVTILVAFACEIARYRAPGVATARLAATVLVLTYVGLMMAVV